VAEDREQIVAYKMSKEDIHIELVSVARVEYTFLQNLLAYCTAINGAIKQT
jgi:hypothetical protein